MENTVENRRAYRQLFYTAPGLGGHISGAIMYKEALAQSSSMGVPFVECLQRQGIIPGIKVDEVKFSLCAMVCSYILLHAQRHDGGDVWRPSVTGWLWCGTLQGLQPMEGSSSETTTRGLDNLATNAAAYFRCCCSRNASPPTCHRGLHIASGPRVAA